MDIQQIRQEYDSQPFKKEDLKEDPFEMFEVWMQEALEKAVLEANAFCLATVGKEGKPSSRTLLLKEFSSEGFIFYSNYESRKAKQIEENPHGSMTFFWKELARQVVLEGVIAKTSPEISNAYFKIRTRESQIGAWASRQDQILDSREVLEEKFERAKEQFEGKEVERPSFWGGYCLQPFRIEFWQGRKNRLHDRFLYQLNPEGKWEITRLSP